MKSANDAITEAKKVLENKAASTDELKGAFERLQNLTHKLSSDLYKKQGAQPGAEGQQEQGGGEASSENKGNDDVIDADYKDGN